jgi:hypothetical protein
LEAELATLGSHLDTAAVNTDLARLGELVTAQKGNTTGAASAAQALVTLANTVDAAVTDISSAVDKVVALLPTSVQNALLEVKQLNTIIDDVNRFGPAAQQDPEYQPVLTELNTALNLATTISNALTNLQQRARNFGGLLQTLDARLSSLLSKAKALETTTTNVVSAGAQRVETVEASVAGDIQSRVAKARSTVNTLEAQLRTAAATTESNIQAGVANAQATVNGLESKAGQAINTSQAKASQAVANAQAKATQAQATASQAIASASATVSQDVAAAAQQAQQSIQSSQAAAQANMAQVTSQGEDILAQANSEYAYLLALNEQAGLNQLPEGTATGATVQNGSFLFLIQGS